MTIRVVDEKEVMMILAIMMAFLSGGLMKEFILGSFHCQGFSPSFCSLFVPWVVTLIVNLASATLLVFTYLRHLEKK